MADENSNTTLYKVSKLKSLFKNRDYSDCCFVVDGEKIQAHKLILACSSPVFERMFYGNFSSSGEIEIVGISATEFKQMLEYIYTDDVTFISVHNAWNLYSAAHRYLLEDLLGFCVSYIEKNLAISNLCLSYELANVYGENNLKTRCWNDLLHFTKDALLYSPEFHMKPAVFEKLLQDTVSLTWSDKLACIISWAIRECDDKYLDLTSTNIESVIIDRDLLKCIFMTEEITREFLEKLDVVIQDVTKYVLKTDRVKKEVLDKPDFVQKYLEGLYHILGKGQTREEVSHLKRNAIGSCSSCGIRDCYKVARRVTWREYDAFTFDLECDRKVILFGLLIDAEQKLPIAHSTYYYKGINTISLINSQGEEDLLATCTGKYAYNSSLRIPFDNHIVLDPDQKYTFQIKYSRSDLQPSNLILYYLTRKFRHNNTVFTFDETDGTVVRGLFCYPV